MELELGRLFPGWIGLILNHSCWEFLGIPPGRAPSLEGADAAGEVGKGAEVLGRGERGEERNTL